MYIEAIPGLAIRDSLDTTQIDAVIFEINNVIIDISESQPPAAASAVRQYLKGCLGWADADMLLPGDMDSLRKAGGFSEYLDIAAVTVLFFICKSVVSGDSCCSELRESSPTLGAFANRIRRKGGGMETAMSLTLDRLDEDLRASVLRQWNIPFISLIFQDLYAGSDLCQEIYGRAPHFFKGPGTIGKEHLILHAGYPASARRHLGLFTGRNRGEMQAALKLLGSGNPFSDQVFMTMEDARKPDPTALAKIKRIMGSANPVYVGSTVDDLYTVNNLRAAGESGVFAAVLTGFGGGDGNRYFKCLGADIIADDVNVLMRFIRGVSPGLE